MTKMKETEFDFALTDGEEHNSEDEAGPFFFLSFLNLF